MDEIKIMEAIDRKGHDFSKKLTNGHNFRDLVTGYIGGFKDAMLSVEDINRIGELFNIAQDELEKEQPGYADWGVPSYEFNCRVLKKFYEEKFRNI